MNLLKRFGNLFRMGKRMVVRKHGSYFPATNKNVKHGEAFTQAETDIGDFIIRRLAPGMYEIVSKPCVADQS
jgi:hypothetical protein